MALLLHNNCEGGTDEIDVNNTDTASGNVWTSTSRGVGVALVWDTAQAATGGLSIRWSTGGTSTTVFTAWSGAAFGTPSRVYGRMYVRWSSIQGRTIHRIRSGATQIARVAMGTGGTLELRNTASSTVASTTATMTTNTWYRVEWDIRPGSAGVTNTLRLYAGHSAAVIEEISASSDWSAAATADSINFGQVTNAASLADAWMDEFVVNDVDWPGAAGVAPLPSPYRPVLPLLVR